MGNIKELKKWIKSLEMQNKQMKSSICEIEENCSCEVDLSYVNSLVSDYEYCTDEIYKCIDEIEYNINKLI